MSGLETAIRNALDRSDRTNAEVRARIYQSARNALENGLRKQEISDPAVIAAQRHRLEQSIKEIERDERRQLGELPHEPEPDQFMGLEADFAAIEANDPRDAEDAAEDAEDFGALRAERLGSAQSYDDDVPVSVPEVAGLASGRPGRRGRSMAQGQPKKRRSTFARLFIMVIFLAAIGIGIWWVYASGVLLTSAERDTSVANPPAAVSEEDLPPQPGVGGDKPSFNGTNTFSKDWVEIFKGDDIDSVTASGLGSAKLTSTSDGPVIRIVSANASAEAAVRLLLPEDQISLSEGQEATLAVSMRSASDQAVDVSIDCDFGTAEKCDRHRFTVTSQRSDALIQVTSAAGQGNGAPALVLTSDMEGKGRGVDILAVRLLKVN